MSNCTFSIYQLKLTPENQARTMAFMSLSYLRSLGAIVDPGNYDMVYSAELEDGVTLEALFTRFNMNHPADYTGRSLSVSDVVVFHENGRDSAYYVDSFGFSADIPEFLGIISREDMHKYGYFWDGMRAFDAEVAKALRKAGICLYKLYTDDTEGMVESDEELEAHASHGGIFGFEKWAAASL